MVTDHTPTNTHTHKINGKRGILRAMDRRNKAQMKSSRKRSFFSAPPILTPFLSFFVLPTLEFDFKTGTEFTSEGERGSAGLNRIIGRVTGQGNSAGLNRCNQKGLLTSSCLGGPGVGMSLWGGERLEGVRWVGVGQTKGKASKGEREVLPRYGASRSRGMWPVC